MPAYVNEHHYNLKPLNLCFRPTLPTLSTKESEYQVTLGEVPIPVTLTTLPVMPTVTIIKLIFQPLDTVFEAAREAAATTGRGGRGVVITFSAGNSALDNEDCNYSEYATSPYIITVGASNANGTKSVYSEPCAALFVNAPSNDLRDYMPGITTLTSTSNTACSDDFGGKFSILRIFSEFSRYFILCTFSFWYCCLDIRC